MILFSSPSFSASAFFSITCDSPLASPSHNSNPLLSGLAPMIAIKLCSTNFIYWRTQMMPILTYQGLFSHVDGSLPPPSPLIRSNDKEVANPDYAQWVKDEQQAIILLNASLTEEAFSITIGLTSARDIWVALEAAFCNVSVERVQNLRDNLRALKKGDKSVAEFGCAFKAICDQLSAIGHPVDSMEQLHWFLCGLGTSFESFSTSTRSLRPIPNFVDLLASDESHEMFMKNLHGSVDTPTVAFTAQTSPQRPNTFGSSYRPQRSQQAQFRPNRLTFNNYRGSNRQFGRQSRPPTCQLFRKNWALCQPMLSTFYICCHCSSFSGSSSSSVPCSVSN
ncbi:hypothetical protein HanPI659440_Chr01g0007901 [Helianthus annuus]|nr:hypothetical protein HanPI659440_Chr01g0007901 [Helianthus annuus]